VLTAIPKSLERRFAPTSALAMMVPFSQQPQYTFRAPWSKVVLTRSELVTLKAGVKWKRLPYGREASFLVIILWVEAADDPAFSFNNCQSDDHGNPAVLLSSGLFQPPSTFWLIVLVPDQYDPRQLGKCLPEIEDCTPASSRISLARLSVEVPMSPDSQVCG
jgi:hypothetical protein